jgi:hypothetical protein
MRIAFFVSSIGDTDLAKATISKLADQESVELISIISLTTAADKRTEDLIGNKRISRISLNEITQRADALSNDKVSGEDLAKILFYISENRIQRAYLGVPSTNNVVPFQIGESLKIPCTIAYEYMFKPAKHAFWSYVDGLTSKGNCDFAVTLPQAKLDILEISANAKVHEIGHLSLDRQQENKLDPMPTRKSLSVNIQDELVFISGSTQPIKIDNQFLDAILNEISTENYPSIQLRMGIHPGVKDLDAYLQTLLATCEKYSRTKDQFKIILTDSLEKRLKQPISSDLFILRAEVSGSEAAQAADKISQSVPGALLNEAALAGKPSYFHEKSTTPYLPSKWFSESISSFFTAQPQKPRSREDLGLKDTAPNIMAKLLNQ